MGKPRRPKTERTGPAQSRALRAEKAERAARHDAKRDEIERELKRIEKTVAAVRRGDDWANILTGLGIQGRDWRASTCLEQDAILDRQQLDDSYTQDNLCARLVDALPEDAVRKWIRIVGGSGTEARDFETKIFTHFTRLHVKQTLLQWMKLGRKDGGCLMLIGADDGRDLSSPLDPQRVKEVRHVHCLERWATIPDVIDLDPLSANFGKPLFYLLLPRAVQSSTFVAPSPKLLREQNTLDGLRIHYSRVFAHDGVQISERRKVAQRGWGYSVLQRAWWPILNYRMLWGHLATAFKHTSQTVIQFAGYQELQAADFQGAIQARLAAIQLSRSTLNIVPLDSEDKMQEMTLRGISGALEIIKYAQEDLAQAMNMPLTKLFGMKPAGFSNDDTAGGRNWYDLVRAAQEDFLIEPLTMLVEIIAAAYGIAIPKDWRIEFLPLEQLDEAEEAKRQLALAQADEIRINTGVVTAQEVRETLRADSKVMYLMEDGEIKHPNIQPVPLPAQLPPDPIANDKPADPKKPTPSPGDPSQHLTIEHGPKGTKVAVGGNSQ